MPLAKRNLIASILIIPLALALALGLAACGGSYYDERAAQAQYLSDRGEYLEDAALTSKVAAVITDDRTLQNSKIHVRTYGNTVHLTGYVASRSDAMRAEDLALEVPGVRRVDNDLFVQ
jgi:osmotically-inducible protein OsmY